MINLCMNLSSNLRFSSRKLQRLRVCAGVRRLEYATILERSQLCEVCKSTTLIAA
jgi:hypothetical protein